VKRRVWLSYGYYPDIKTAYDIAKALGVSMEYLLTGKDDLAGKSHAKETLTRKTAAADIKRMIKKIEIKAALI